MAATASATIAQAGAHDDKRKAGAPKRLWRPTTLSHGARYRRAVLGKPT